MRLGLRAFGSTDWLVWYEGGKYVYDHVSNASSVVAPSSAPSYPDVRPALAEAQDAYARAEAALALAEAKAAKLDALGKLIQLVP